MSAQNLTVSAVVRRAIADSFDRLVAHESDDRIDDDPESVHQARVAMRRLRSDLRTFHRFIDKRWAAHLGSDLRWIGSEFGVVRDIEVQRERLRSHAARLPGPEMEAARRVIRRLDADRAAARADLDAMLREPRYEQTRAELILAATNPMLNDAACELASDALRPAVRGRWRKLRRSVRRLGDNPSDEALHAVRVRAKKCRYAAEACEPVFGKRARRLARAAANIQDVLGEHHDAVVAVAWLAKTAHECSPAEAYAIGMLAEIEREAAAVARAAFPAAWRRANSKRVHGWL